MSEGSEATMTNYYLTSSAGSKNPLIPVLLHGRFLLSKASYAVRFAFYEFAFIFTVMGVVIAVRGFSLVYVEIYDERRSVFFDVCVVAGIVVASNAAHTARLRTYLAVEGIPARPHKVHGALFEVRYADSHMNRPRRFASLGRD